MQTGITQTTFRVVVAMNRLGGISNTGEGGENAVRCTQTTFRIVIALNRLGGKSNTGEDGEDADRYTDDIQNSHCREQARWQIKHRGGRRGCRQVHRRHSE